MKLQQILIGTLIYAILTTVNGRLYYLIPSLKSRDMLMEKSERHEVMEPVFKTRGFDRTEYYGGRGRVMIKVYRGPANGDHAPHGYWVRQPADDFY